jgi:hypothetical protein
MKKEYTKPLVTVVELIADCHIAAPSPWGSDYKSENDIFVGEDELE